MSKDNEAWWLGCVLIAVFTIDRVQVTVRAEINHGCLKISGQDFGVAVLDFFKGNDDEYEYFYRFDKAATARLLHLLSVGAMFRISGNDTVKAILPERFCGMDGCEKLRKFCKENDIKYEFFSYY
jgi:hypothetical protein